MTLDDLKEMEKTNVTRWAIHLLETAESDQLRKIMDLITKVLDKS